MQESHREGFDWVLKPRLQAKQELLDVEGVFVFKVWFGPALRTAALVFLMAKFLAFACSLKRTRMKLLRNQRAALVESGMKALP